MADKKRILVADDDPDVLGMLELYLAQQGFEVLPATNGKEALQFALSQNFDLILLDVMMPYIGGYQVAYEIGDKLGAKAPRILIMTSRDTAKETGLAIISGVYELIQKPFELDELNERICRIFSGGSSEK